MGNWLLPAPHWHPGTLDVIRSREGAQLDRNSCFLEKKTSGRPELCSVSCQCWPFPLSTGTVPTAGATSAGTWGPGWAQGGIWGILAAPCAQQERESPGPVGETRGVHWDGHVCRHKTTPGHMQVCVCACKHPCAMLWPCTRVCGFVHIPQGPALGKGTLGKGSLSQCPCCHTRLETSP